MNINAVILRRGIRDIALQPAAMFLFLILTSIVLLLAVGVSAETESGRLVALTFFGGVFEGEMLRVFVRSLLSIGTGIVLQSVVFLTALLAGSVYLEATRHPLLSITLTSGIDRSTYAWTRLAAFVVFLFLLFLCFGAAACVALGVKTGVWALRSFSLCCLVLFVRGCILLGMSTLCALLVQQTTAVVVLCFAYVFFLSPLLTAYVSSHPALGLVNWVLPPDGLLNPAIARLFVGERVDLFPLVQSIPFIVVALWAGVARFRRMDLK